METLPEKIRQLDVQIGQEAAGSLVRDSQFVFAYRRDDPAQPGVGLFMPPTKLVYQDGGLFPVMDQNLPEGYLFQRIREMFPKQPLNQMHLLALAGTNGVGRLGFTLAGQAPVGAPVSVSRKDILSAKAGSGIFEQLVHAYLSTGIGIAGVQPKIMVPERATVSVPNLIVKTGSVTFPGLAANEFVCLSAARRAGIKVPAFELSDDASMLVLERFDLFEDGTRMGFEDVAALMGRQVRDSLSERKYHGSYEAVAEVFRTINLSHADLEEFFSQVAFSVMVRNGDAHLKNFGVLYTTPDDVHLAPMFDVVTTAIYRYTRFEGGPALEDNTMALKLLRGKASKSRGYPAREDLLAFGSRVCGVTRPQEIIERIGQGMSEALNEMKTDARVPKELLGDLTTMWQHG